MNQLTTAIVCAALAAVAATNIYAAPRGKASPKSALDILREQQELLRLECKLTDDQLSGIQAKFKLKQDALAAWEKTHADKVKAAEEAAKAARQGADASVKKQAAATLRDLAASRAQATAEADKAIQDTLTEEQRMTWAGVELAQTVLPRLKKAGLTDDQTAKIKCACLAAAKDLAVYTGDDKKDKQGRAAVQKNLRWAIDNVILTPAQRETLGLKAGPKGGKK